MNQTTYWLIIVVLIIVVLILLKHIQRLNEKTDKDYIERFNSGTKYLIYNKFQLSFSAQKRSKEAFGSITDVRLDNKTYRVVSKYNDKRDAAEILKKIHEQNLKLISFLRDNYPNMDLTKNLVRRYTPDAIFEVDPFNKSGETSYSVDKGREIGLCLRQKTQKKEFVNLNDITFVVIHELAHVSANTFGSASDPHNYEFIQNFDFLLAQAIKLNIYKSVVDYMTHPVPYCGVTLRDPIPIRTRNAYMYSTSN